MFRIADKLIKGDRLIISYPNAALDANINYRIAFESSNSLFKIDYTAHHNDGNLIKSSKDFTAAELINFLSSQLEFLEEEDQKLLPESSPDMMIVESFEKIKNGTKLNFSYLSRSEGGRFEYDLSYDQSSHLFRLLSKEHYLFEDENHSSQFLNYSEAYHFLILNKAHISL